MSFVEKVAQIRDSVLNQSIYSVAIKDLDSRVEKENLAKALEQKNVIKNENDMEVGEIGS